MMGRESWLIMGVDQILKWSDYESEIAGVSGADWVWGSD
jgi:hypothetical protein